MDNENGTAAAVVTTKVDEPKPAEITTTKTDSIDTAAIVETIKSAEVANLDDKLADAAVKTGELKALNNSSANDVVGAVAVNKTTTTVTVNVTQTKVKLDTDVVDKGGQGISEVVSSVSSIAEAAVGAIEKAEQELKKSDAVNEANSIEDIEMADAEADCEMKDVSLVEEQPQVVTTTTTTKSETKNVEADSVNSSNITLTGVAEPAAAAVISEATASQANEAEQKIDDVEKNISNLFNGDDNVVSTNDDDKQNDDLSKAENSAAVVASSQNDNDLLKNGIESSGSCKGKQQSHDAIKDNNDLVSILAGSDKPDEDISSSVNVSASDTSDAVSKNVSEAKSIENKPLKSVSSSTSPSSSSTTQSNINNGPPIQKQCDPVASNETHKGLGGKASRQEIISSHSSTTVEKSSDLSGQCPAESSSTNVKDTQNINGLSDVINALIGKKESPTKSDIIDSSSATIETATTPKTSVAKIVPEQSTYDVNVSYDNSELVYFSVKRQGTNSSSGQLNTTEIKEEVKGTAELCTFIIDHFEKIRSKLTGNETVQRTPATSGRGRGKKSEPSTPLVTNTGSKRKRGAAVEVPESPVTDSESQPKSAKKAKKEPTTPKAAAAESEYPEKAVLARWVDKKFYAGRVIEQKPNSKYVVLFEDGAKKTLPEEHILFGKENILPLVNENVHALVDGDTYEPGNVQSVETKDDGVYYTVLCESTTVTVTASDIYLEEEQAKVILSKQATNNPEPGFSGGSSTRKDRRNKRAETNRHVQWFSESDVSDINESDSRPASPVTVLEAVDGVQPELQHTQKESELVRICYLMERFGSDFKKVNLDNVLGPINQTNILKNKSFLLTCTIPIKTATNGTNERQNVRHNGYDFSNRNTVFSSVPFFKDYLKQQIEAAGGTVYSNFENIPTNKYRNCFLLAPFPCITAKYVQCLAANITAVSHEWIVESCQRNKLLNKDEYVLPSGWSIIESKYKPWSIGRGRDQRKNAFNKTTIILTSQQSDFVEFWSRVCKSAGAKIRLVKSTNDITATTKGYILLDDEFPPEYQIYAENFHIPIVSTVWVIQSLILGKVCDPNAHPKLTQLYEDDYF
ncbi:mucin-5AC-like [Contarinia nasturtii]|uniref:mucin-5AC-like n=1 Tax=Contarinia nasturtii TaxID=265458 RepID=UPI0012D49065|nr:mucin-5AC-like [Contarinia nasturtii]